jgi:succinate dehydrogenase / fumarate reductase cytochrome b subunit
MAETRTRPLSPHLSIWKWGPHMLVSILHRITGGALSVAGLAVLAWWLSAIAAGPDEYELFTSVAGHWAGIVVLVGLSWAWFQHLLSGIRHLFTDAGQALELGVNKSSAYATMIGSALLTAALWLYILEIGR